MKLAVIGAGLMGRAVLADFARHEEVEQLGIYDLNGDLAEEIGRKFSGGRATAGVIDATDEDQAAAILEQFDAAVACTSYRHNVSLPGGYQRGLPSGRSGGQQRGGGDADGDECRSRGSRRDDCPRLWSCPGDGFVDRS